ncbi:MAG: bifunctional phosphoribosylaminoimidazolecarboxamide formyltransferase/IMP cyclohydrolase [Chloroflexota bacterium]|nr:MAG: bifunctional phosphoribosylaminoimidazolecarboxamide formyltransferase/IMP cyclohydrolase [Chloroflexota bacterium]
MRAIISVSDKTGLIDLASGLANEGWEIFSTGGTKKALVDAGVAVHSVSDVTGFPEILEGRVKTLHPHIHGGILAKKDDAEHVRQLAEHGIEAIDLVVVNLYPFAQTVARPDATLSDALENIDIGGPTMIRAAAKNFPSVLIVVDPADYPEVLRRITEGSVDLEMRKILAQKAFQHTATYDTAIAHYLRPAQQLFPPELTLAMSKVTDLRYGENPHQSAAFYREKGRPVTGLSVAAATQLHGKELSYNNILDLDAAIGIVNDFGAPTVVVVKHHNPCGLASNADLTEAYRRALAGDPISAFGGIVGFNRVVDAVTAEEIARTHYDVLIAPGYEEAALERLKRKRDMRILAVGDGVTVQEPNESTPRLEVRQVSGGYLIQTRDEISDDDIQLQPVTARRPTLEEITDLIFAWRSVKHVKSNAIVLVKEGALVGVGAGQPNRALSVEIAAKQAKDRAVGSVLASDAFFPFPDGVELAARAGVTAIIQPGGSLRDEEVIRIANRNRLAMVFTSRRHFKH